MTASESEITQIIHAVDKNAPRYLVLRGVEQILTEMHPRIEEVTITHEDGYFLILLAMKGEQSLQTDIAAACAHKKLAELIRDAQSW